MKNKIQDEKTYAELERVEDKYIINLADVPTILSEIKKNMGPAYPDPNTKDVMINTTYLDSPKMDFFRHHAYGMLERMKVRLRKYGPNGKWDNSAVFLEIKEKEHDTITKKRIQLDSDNLKRVKNGQDLKFNAELEQLNTPLYTHTDLKRYIELYRKISIGHEITPALSVTYKRLAYGKGPLRITIDTNLSYKPERTMSLSTAFKIKKAVDWKDVKEYGSKYDPKQNAILEIKHNSSTLPIWLQKLLDERGLKPEKFSKYVYSACNIIGEIVGD